MSLLRGRVLFNRKTNIQRAIPSSVGNTDDWSCIAVVATGRDTHISLIRADPVRNIEADPTNINIVYVASAAGMPRWRAAEMKMCAWSWHTPLPAATASAAVVAASV